MPAHTRLMLIDGHALVHRAFHAVPELSTSEGELTNAVFGFTAIVLKEIAELRPTHIIMAMDRPAPTFRHDQYPRYKAHRPPTPAPLASQFQRVRQVAAALHIPIQEVDGFEADDVLGTLARQADERGIPTTIVTGDLDALQLVTDNTHVLTPGRGASETALYDPIAVHRRFGLDARLLPDWKALVGDASDNIAGVPGIGKKTASDLLAAHGGLEGIYDHLSELSDRRRATLEENREQAFRNRTLATIVCDVPVELGLERSHFADVERDELIGLLLELEFQSLIDRVRALFPAPEEVVPPAAPETGGATQLSLIEPAGSKTMAPERQSAGVATQASLLESGPARFHRPDTEMRIVRTERDLDDLARHLSDVPAFAVDTETTSTDALRARLVGLSFSTRLGRGWYVPVGHAEGEQLPPARVLNRLRPVLEDPGTGKVGHNLKYDYALLRRYGVELAPLAFDTMIAAYLNPRGRGLSLSSLALARLDLEMTPIEALIGKGKTQITMDLVPIEIAAEYAADDASVALRLRDVLAPELEAQGLTRLFDEVEMPLVAVLARMEAQGITLDPAVLETMSAEMTEALGHLEGAIYREAGYRFNISSTRQLGQVLFQQLKLPAGRRTKTGPSTDSEVLEGLRGKHPIVDQILEYRQLLKLKNTYIDALPALADPDTGKIHTDFNQTVAATGRLSSSNPNLQNIPVRGELGRRIRRAFVPGGPDHVLLAADYSQIELRVLASMSNDERLVEAFQAGQDVHRATAAAVFGVSPEDVTPDQRRIAKVVNFGIIYGIGEQRLAYETGISREEAASFIARYNQTYAGVKAFMDRLRKQAAFDGYVSTLLGRRRYFPEVHSDHPGLRAAAERAAINMPIQGTAADIIKLAMIRLDRELADGYPDAHMVLQVHDELVFDLPAADVAGVSGLVLDTMEHALPLNVPLEAELKVGRDWYDMTPVPRGASVREA